MAIKKVYELSVDLKKTTTRVNVPVLVQGDSAEFRIRLLDDGNPLSTEQLTGITAVRMQSGYDAQTVIQTVGALQGSVAVFRLKKNELFRAGTVQAMVQLEDSADRISTLRFQYQVIPDLAGNYIPGEQDITVFQRYMNDAQAKIDEMAATDVAQLTVKLADKVGGGVKAEPEDLATRTLDLVTGGTVNILSEPQVGSVTHEKTTFLSVLKNLFNKNTVKTDIYVSGVSGNLIAAPGFSTSDYIPCKPNTTYTRKQSNYIAYARMDKSHISGSSTSGLTFTTPEDCYHFRISMSTSVVQTEQVEEGAVSTSYEPYKEKLKDGLVLPNAFADKTILFMGDSITQMANGWVSVFNEIIKPKSFVNVAVSGARWRDYPNQPAYDGNPVFGGDNLNNVLGNQVQKVLNNNYAAPDAIIIAASTNDDPPEASDVETHFTNAGTYIPLSSVDRTTFAGAMRWCVEVLRNKYPNAQIMIGTPIQRAENSRPNVVTKAKADKVIEVTNRLSAISIDAFNRSGITGKTESAGVKGQYLADGLHPISTVETSAVVGSETGSKKLGKFYAQEFKTKFVHS